MIRKNVSERKISSLLYVSYSLLILPAGLVELDVLVEKSRLRNSHLGVTGALIFTEKQFAQCLEGPRAAIDELMVSINSDSRHRAVKVVKNANQVPRRFVSWSLAYRGTATFVDGLIDAARLDAPADDSSAMALHRLEDAIYQFAIRGGGRTLGR
jgi:hypothetical protein